jgi:hypothetical protein
MARDVSDLPPASDFTVVAASEINRSARQGMGNDLSSFIVTSRTRWPIVGKYSGQEIAMRRIALLTV